MASQPKTPAKSKQAAPKDAPTNASPPVVSGDPTVGKTLTCTNGEWDNPPDNFGYVWRADDINIPGSSFSSFTLAPEHKDQMIMCCVTATNADGSETAYSNEVGPVQAAVDPPDPALPEMHTIAEEQRARSAKIQAMGVEDWKDSVDERPPAERTNPQIAGVGPTQVSAQAGPPQPGSWAGSTRSTPEARKAQHPAASR